MEYSLTRSQKIILSKLFDGWKITAKLRPNEPKSIKNIRVYTAILANKTTWKKVQIPVSPDQIQEIINLRFITTEITQKEVSLILSLAPCTA